jgi:excisionase family DNA binding protein
MSIGVLMSLPKAAAYLGIGRNAMRALVRDGKIAATWVPSRKHPMFMRPSLDAFLEAHTPMLLGTIGGTNHENGSGQSQQNVGHFETSPKLTKTREAQLDEMFARK